MQNNIATLFQRFICYSFIILFPLIFQSCMTSRLWEANNRVTGVQQKTSSNINELYYKRYNFIACKYQLQDEVGHPKYKYGFFRIATRYWKKVHHDLDYFLTPFIQKHIKGIYMNIIHSPWKNAMSEFDRFKIGRSYRINGLGDKLSMVIIFEPPTIPDKDIIFETKKKLTLTGTYGGRFEFSSALQLELFLDSNLPNKSLATNISKAQDISRKNKLFWAIVEKKLIQKYSDILINSDMLFPLAWINPYNRIDKFSQLNSSLLLGVKSKNDKNINFVTINNAREYQDYYYLFKNEKDFIFNQKNYTDYSESACLLNRPPEGFNIDDFNELDQKNLFYFCLYSSDCKFYNYFKNCDELFKKNKSVNVDDKMMSCKDYYSQKGITDILNSKYNSKIKFKINFYDLKRDFIYPFPVIIGATPIALTLDIITFPFQFINFAGSGCVPP